MAQFPDNLDFAYASKMKTEVACLFSGAKSVAIDLTNVERASLACMQVLVAAHDKAKREDIQLVIDASESFTIMLQKLGLDYILNKERIS